MKMKTEDMENWRKKVDAANLAVEEAAKICGPFLFALDMEHPVCLEYELRMMGVTVNISVNVADTGWESCRRL